MLRATWCTQSNVATPSWTNGRIDDTKFTIKFGIFFVMRDGLLRPSILKFRGKNLPFPGLNTFFFQHDVTKNSPLNWPRDTSLQRRAKAKKVSGSLSVFGVFQLKKIRRVEQRNKEVGKRKRCHLEDARGSNVAPNYMVRFTWIWKSRLSNSKVIEFNLCIISPIS